MTERPRIWTPGGEEPQQPRPEPETIELTPEQLAEAVRRLAVGDVLISTFSTVLQLGFAKLDRQSRDLDQARLAVEALRALVPVLEGAAPAELVRDLKQAVANLQLAYATAAGEEGGPEADAQSESQSE
jgi:hypothetical protein